MKLWCITLLCLATLNITACDYGSPTPKTLEKPPFARTADTSSPANVDPRETAIPATDADGLTVDSISGLSANNKLSGPIGLTTDRLFNAPVTTEDERFTRLENAVQGLADRVNQMSPSIKRLMEVDADLDNLMYQLETLVNQRETSPTTPLVAPDASQSTASGGGGSGGIIQDIRIADHPGKTRLVFETSQKPSVTTTVNADKTVSILLDTNTTPLDMSKLAKKSDLISSLSVQPQSGVTLVTLTLKRNSEKIDQVYLPPDKETSNHRVYIDLRR